MKSRARKEPKRSPIILNRARVVATVHSIHGLEAAHRMEPNEVDLLEFRVDALFDQLATVRRALARVKVPVLLTARHPAEGGLHKLSLYQRRELLLEFLPFAALVDIELRSASAMRDIIRTAKAHKVGVVISNHHFHSLPTLSAMRSLQSRAFAAGADVFKLAAKTATARSLARLLEFASMEAAKPRAIMGMGEFGQVSRLALARAGSVLNYGYLDKPNAPGQWEARELKRLFSVLGL